MSVRKIKVKSGRYEAWMEVSEEEYQRYFRPWWQQKKQEQRNREEMEKHGYSILVICQELFEKDFDVFPGKRVTLIDLRYVLCKTECQFRLDIIFGIQLFAGVQLVFDQQSKNESYKFTRCKRECSFVLMFGYLSIFS